MLTSKKKSKFTPDIGTRKIPRVNSYDPHLPRGPPDPPSAGLEFRGGADLDPQPKSAPPELRPPLNNLGEVELRAVTLANSINLELRG